MPLHQIKIAAEYSYLSTDYQYKYFVTDRIVLKETSPVARQWHSKHALTPSKK
jgi:hypothetical protein